MERARHLHAEFSTKAKVAYARDTCIRGPARYIRTHLSVVIPCPKCKAKMGDACYNKQRDCCVSEVHVSRREAWRALNKDVRLRVSG